MARYPLIIFSKSEAIRPPEKKGFLPPSAGHPDKTGQARRIQQQFESVISEITDLPVNTDKVLVLETIGIISDFQKAATKIPGMQWLAEIDDELDYEEVEDLYPEADDTTQQGLRKDGKRLYLAVSNRQAIERLLGLWNAFNQHRQLDHGYGIFANFFKYLKDVRFWNYQDMLRETGILDEWQEHIATGKLTSNFELELHFKQTPGRREATEIAVRECIERHGGALLSHPVVIAAIGFHAMKVTLPVSAIARCMESHEVKESIKNILSADFIKYCRPMSSMGLTHDETTGEESDVDLAPCTDRPPTMALLDGAPLLRHEYLNDRLMFDDPDDYETQYTDARHRRHGTAMASLMCHGDLNDTPPSRRSLTRRIYVRPVMFENTASKDRDEEFDARAFPEDITVRAVRRMFLSLGGQQAVAPTIRVINLSVGNVRKPFLREMSQWARALDWLAWEHRVLFVVSAGNYPDPIDIDDTSAVTRSALTYQDQHQRFWHILSPAESINAVTVGALNADRCTPAPYNPNVDLLGEHHLPALYSRLGSGYRRQIKPDIVVRGGKMYYYEHVTEPGRFSPRTHYPRGLCHAVPGAQPHTLKTKVHTSGTSNAAALTSHAAGRIWEMLEDIREQHANIPSEYDALLIKALLIHGASWRSLDIEAYNRLKNPSNAHSWKRYVSRLVGYGEPDFSRVVECDENRATMLGFDEIGKEWRNTFALPFPPNMRSAHDVRLTVTLAWFSPVNPYHQAFRRAKLSFSVQGTELQRQDCDGRHVQKGTVQHEVFALNSGAAEGTIAIHVDCKPDSGQSLDEHIPYGLAVTLETSDAINIYDPIAQRVQTPVSV